MSCPLRFYAGSNPAKRSISSLGNLVYFIIFNCLPLLQHFFSQFYSCIMYFFSDNIFNNLTHNLLSLLILLEKSCAVHQYFIIHIFRVCTAYVLHQESERCIILNFPIYIYCMRSITKRFSCLNNCSFNMVNWQIPLENILFNCYILRALASPQQYFFALQHYSYFPLYRLLLHPS